MNELHQHLDGVLRKHTEECFRQRRISEIIGRVKSHTSTIGTYQRWVNDGRGERRPFPEVVKSFGDVIGFRVICPRIGLAQVVDEFLTKIGETPADVEVEYQGSERHHTSAILPMWVAFGYLPFLELTVRLTPIPDALPPAPNIGIYNDGMATIHMHQEAEDFCCIRPSGVCILWTNVLNGHYARS